MPRAQNKAMPPFLKTAIAALTMRRRGLEVLKIAQRAGLNKAPVRFRPAMQAVTTKAALDAWLAGAPLRVIYGAARTDGFAGSRANVWVFLERPTDWPKVLWSSPAAQSPQPARRKVGRVPATGKTAALPLYLAYRAGGLRRLIHLTESHNHARTTAADAAHYGRRRAAAVSQGHA